MNEKFAVVMVPPSVAKDVRNINSGARKLDHPYYLAEERKGSGKATCLAGETRVLTRYGVSPIRDLAGGYHELLTHEGEWVKAPIQSFGVQPLQKVVFRRNGVSKSVFATSDHIWLYRGGAKSDRLMEATTEHLAGRSLRIPSVFPKSVQKDVDPEAVARGFVFGDGDAQYPVLPGSTCYSRAHFFGNKDSALLPIFGDLGFGTGPTTPRGRPEQQTIRMLPLEWKTELPSLWADPSYIYGWLAGYFAADGRVSTFGHVELNSANRESLEYVRLLCQQVGIGTFGIHEVVRADKTLRIGNYQVDTSRPLYGVNLLRSSLGKEFFLIPEHKERFSSPYAYERTGWSVVSVEPTKRIEEVFCATVPGAETFVLEDNILTHNCRQCGEMIEEGDPTLFFHYAPDDDNTWVRNRGTIHRDDCGGGKDDWTKCPRCSKQVPSAEWSKHWKAHRSDKKASSTVVVGPQCPHGVPLGETFSATTTAPFIYTTSTANSTVHSTMTLTAHCGKCEEDQENDLERVHKRRVYKEEDHEKEAQQDPIPSRGPKLKTRVDPYVEDETKDLQVDEVDDAATKLQRGVKVMDRAVMGFKKVVGGDPIDKLLDHARNMMGEELKGEYRERVKRAVMDPTPENWEHAYGIVLSEHMSPNKPYTLWQVVSQEYPHIKARVTDVKGNVIQDWGNLPDSNTIQRALWRHLGPKPTSGGGNGGEYADPESEPPSTPPEGKLLQGLWKQSRARWRSESSVSVRAAARARDWWTPANEDYQRSLQHHQNMLRDFSENVIPEYHQKLKDFNEGVKSLDKYQVCGGCSGSGCPACGGSGLQEKEAPRPPPYPRPPQEPQEPRSPVPRCPCTSCTGNVRDNAEWDRWGNLTKGKIQGIRPWGGLYKGGYSRLSRGDDVRGAFNDVLDRYKGDKYIVGLANNTGLHEDEDHYHVRLHNTDVLSFHKQKPEVTIDDGGYDTLTTRDRMNSYLPRGIGVGGREVKPKQWETLVTTKAGGYRMPSSGGITINTETGLSTDPGDELIKKKCGECHRYRSDEDMPGHQKRHDQYRAAYEKNPWSSCGKCNGSGTTEPWSTACKDCKGLGSQGTGSEMTMCPSCRASGLTWHEGASPKVNYHYDRETQRRTQSIDEPGKCGHCGGEGRLPKREPARL